MSPSLETMSLQHDLLRFSKIGLPGLHRKRKSEKICVTVFQYYRPENGQKLKTAENQWFRGLKAIVGQRVQICFICHLKEPSFEVILENFEVLTKIPW